MKKILMFDFDGVIVDSFDLNLATHHTQTPTTTPQQFRDMFRGNIFAAHHEEENLLENQRVLKFFSDYELGLMEHQLVAGMAEVIKSLAKDYTLVIISSTMLGPINNFLTKHGLHKCFQEILGLEAERNKTKKIKMVFNKYQVSANECLFITDTLGDIKEAEKASVRSIGVSWGFHCREMLEEGVPIEIAETSEELEKLIRQTL